MELVGGTQQRLDVLEQSIGRMSSQAEQHGAVQQVRRTYAVNRRDVGGRFQRIRCFLLECAI